jgi:hypothetical protein
MSTVTPPAREEEERTRHVLRVLGQEFLVVAQKALGAQQSIIENVK